MTLNFVRADLRWKPDRETLTSFSQSYFNWMNAEIIRTAGFSIPDVIGMSIGRYVQMTVDFASRIGRTDGGIYFLRTNEDDVAAMGGLRRLPDGAAEIVRIYTRPEQRGRGCGVRMVAGLIDEARLLGFGVIRLDTAIFMTSAQRIYMQAGFVERDIYPGAEPPPRLSPFFIYMERPL